jgi:hypothetical protein
MIVFKSHKDNGVAIGAYAPVTANMGDNITVDIDTAYPFDDIITVTIQNRNMARAIPVYLRVPGWATNPARTLNGQPITAANGTMIKETCAAKAKCVYVLDFKPEIRVEEWGDFAADGSRTQAGPYSIHRGPLMYSLPLGLNFSEISHHFGPTNDSSRSSNDYEVRATNEQPWNVALDIDISAPAKSLTFHQGAYAKDAAAFNHSGWPCNITGNIRIVPSWGQKLNSAAEPPASPACPTGSKCGPAKLAVFVPYGGTDLRMTELPSSGFS